MNSVESMTFWWENVPRKLPHEELKLKEMEEELKGKEITEINLFPFHGQYEMRKTISVYSE